ncbi:MAG TPA: iron uptake system protein EfeO [Ktedonobacterales bacterium]|jgi:iron uptake system component EfeO
MRSAVALWPLKTYSVSFFLTMLVLMSGLSACGPAGDVTPITISVRDNYFDPNTVTAAPGKAVNIAFHNAGAVPHVVQIVGLTDQTVIQPGQSVTFTVTPQTCQYAIVDALYGADGMVGTLIGGAPDRQASSPTVSPSVAVQGTGAAYKIYLLDQADQLVASAQTFADAIASGDLPGAKALYVSTRRYYERIAPVAQSFGTLESRLNARERDLPDDQWTGFHRLEKALWIDGTTSGQEGFARQLVVDLRELRADLQVHALLPTDVLDLSVALLDQALTTKLNGQEDRYAHTDLADLVANVEGSRAAFAVFAPFLQHADPGLLAEITDRYDRFAIITNTLRGPDGVYLLYTALTPDQLRQLSDAMIAIGEPLSRVASQLK